ncbi:MAG TPA: MFS transporter [Gaiellaceae bacterium]|nr:MFS transporter [Gaiellaceae bacterium]
MKVQVASDRVGIAAFLLGASGMFASLYSTQAILPQLGRDFGVGPARAGLTVSTVVVAIAGGVWFWGPLSDRLGRRRTMIAASSLLVLPTIAAGLAPTFPLLLAARAAQGLCMPGLLAVGLPYVMEAFGSWLGGRAMGVYVSSLVAGGLVGRVGVALVAHAAGWRWGVGGLAVLPAAGALLMARALPETGAPARSGRGRLGVRAQLANAALVRTAAAGGLLFFTFVGSFTYVTYRLERPPFRFADVGSSLIFLLWLLGVVGPFAGRLADRVGWRAAALAALACSATGLLLSLPAFLPTLVLGLGLMTLAMFGGATALQLGVLDAAAEDRGAASALYFTCYYGCAAAGAYLPGLAWQAWRWDGVAACGLAALAAGAALLQLQGYGEFDTGWRSPVANRSNRNG